MRRRREVVPALTGVGAWLIPAWGCPVCVSAFAATMSTLGLGFMATRALLTPLTVLLLGVALVAIGFGARRRRAFGPLRLAVCAAGLLVAAKFFPDAPWTGYVGLAALLTASVWNSRTTAKQEPAPSNAAPLGAR